MDDDTNQDTTPDQAAPTGPSAMRILPEAVWGIIERDGLYGRRPSYTQSA